MTKRQSSYHVTHIVSKRLYLREIYETDLDFLYSLHQDPEVMKYIGPLRSKEEVQSRIQKIRNEYKVSPGFGIWLACLNQTEEPVGWFNLSDLDGNPEMEIGYRLARPYWGKGYTTELVRRLIRYGFRDKDLNQIAAVAAAQNIASIRVLEKTGFQYRRKGWYYNSWVNFYLITPGDGGYRST